MSVRLSNRRTPKGTDGATLRKWAVIFLVAGVVGRCILQNTLLGMNSLDWAELVELLNNDPSAMPILSAALLCEFTESCATPLFAFLLVEGFLRTGSFRNYLLRVCGLALLTELPYNLAMSGSLLAFKTRNPVFSLVIALAMLYFFRRYGGKSVRNVAIKAVVFVAAVLWCVMLNIEHGGFLMVFTLVMWLVREKSNARALYGFCGAMVCTMFDLYYMGACLSCIMLHRYNEERGDQNRIFNYAVYPMVLLLCGIAAKFL